MAGKALSPARTARTISCFPPTVARSMTAAKSNRPLRLLPLLVLVAGLALFFAFGLHRYVTFATLAAERAELLAWVERLGALAPLAFIAVYIAAVAFSLPGGALLTLTAGFLFGMLAGALYSVIGATIGATVLFLAARSAVGGWLRTRAGSAVQRMEEGFRRDAFNYLLVLRLIPIFPFFLVNLVPALLGVSLPTYVIATFVGIIPGSLVYSSVGAGLGTVFDAGNEPDLAIIFTPRVLLPMLGLAAVTLAPVVYRRVRERRRAQG